MNITLDTLIALGACHDSQRTFVDRFGADATATAQDVFRALAELKRVDWLQWLCNAAPKFSAAVGNCEAAHGWQSIVVGAHDAQAGIWLASGSATVEAYGSATVRAYGSATVRAYDSATVRASGSATVEASDSATVLTQYFADGVSTILHGDMSCWIDRRDGSLKITTAAMQAEALQ